MIATPPGVYPVRGVVHLYRRPNLNKRVGGFLAGMSAASLGGIVALAWGTYGAQLRFIGQRMGTGVWGKLVTSLLILGEASVPLYFAFNQSMILLQQKLFEDVLKGKQCVGKTSHVHTEYVRGLQIAVMTCCLQSKACSQSGRSVAVSLEA